MQVLLDSNDIFEIEMESVISPATDDRFTSMKVSQNKMPRQKTSIQLEENNKKTLAYWNYYLDALEL